MTILTDSLKESFGREISEVTSVYNSEKNTEGYHFDTATHRFDCVSTLNWVDAHCFDTTTHRFDCEFTLNWVDAHRFETTTHRF